MASQAGMIPAPDIELQDMQILFAGLLMGAGTQYDLTEDADFLDMAALKTMDASRDWADGSWTGPDYADVLLPELTIEIWEEGAAGITDSLSAFRRAFTARAEPVPLWVKLPGLDPIGTWAKANKRSIPVTNAFEHLAVADVQWRCPEGTWQSVPRSIQLQASATQVAGLEFPLFADGALNFWTTSQLPSTAVLTNDGNAPAWLVGLVEGPIPAGWSFAVDGHVVRYGEDLAAGQAVTIDYSSGQATLADGNDRSYALLERDFAPVPAGGTSNIAFTAASGQALITTADIWR